jgi:hypothetical protein
MYTAIAYAMTIGRASIDNTMKKDIAIAPVCSVIADTNSPNMLATIR